MALIRTSKQPWRRQPQGLVLPTEFAQNSFKWLFIGTPSGLKKVWGKDETNLTYTGTAFASGVESAYSAIGYGPTATADAGTVTSYATLPVASRPESGFVLVHGKRNGTVSTSGICQILNCRSSNETNYVSVQMGNRFAAAGSKNKIILETVGGSFGNLFVDGLDQGGNSSLREYLSGESAVFGGNVTSYAGTAFDIHAKATGSSDYCFPHTVFLLGIADRIFSTDEIVESTRNPYGFLFKPRRRRVFYFDVGGGTATSLIIQDSAHAHAADAPVLTTEWLLAIADAASAHLADAPSLSTDSVLAVSEALHAHVADSLTLSITGSTSLSVADALHEHAADGLILTTDSLLAVADALHAHAVDNLTLDTSNATALTIAEALHGHTADALAFTTDTWLAVADAVHGHLANGVVLTTAETLAILEAVHAHSADNLTLSFGDELAVELLYALARQTVLLAAPRTTTLEARYEFHG